MQAVPRRPQEVARRKGGRRGAISVASLFALAAIAGAPAGAAGPSPELIARKNVVLELWAAGDFARAIDEGRRIRDDFPDDPRGVAALFQVGGQIESRCVVEAETPARVAELLRAAAGFYRECADSPVASGATRELARENFARVEAKLAALAAFDAGDPPLDEANGILAGIEAHRAAAGYLEDLGARRGDSPDAEKIVFLEAVERQYFVDAMQAALTDVHERLKPASPERFAAGRDKYLPMLEAAAARAAERAAAAAERFPDSVHALDFLVYLGESHRCSALAAVARRDMATEAGDAAGTAAHSAVARDRFADALAANRRILERLDATESAPDELPAARDAHTRGRYRAAAAERIADISGLIASFAYAAGSGADAGPPE